MIDFEAVERIDFGAGETDDSRAAQRIDFRYEEQNDSMAVPVYGIRSRNRAFDPWQGLATFQLQRSRIGSHRQQLDIQGPLASL